MLAGYHMGAYTRGLRKYVEWCNEDPARLSHPETRANYEDFRMWLEGRVLSLVNLKSGEKLFIKTWTRPGRWTATDYKGDKVLVREDVSRDERGRRLYRCRKELWRMQDEMPDEL